MINHSVGIFACLIGRFTLRMTLSSTFLSVFLEEHLGLISAKDIAWKGMWKAVCIKNKSASCAPNKRNALVGQQGYKKSHMSVARDIL